MPSYRRCTICGKICEDRGVSRCRQHTNRWATVRTPPLGPDWPAIRRAKLEANPNCEVCGKPAVTVDHIRPRARGGTHAPPNLRSLCAGCAHAKDVADAHEGRKRR